MFPFHKPSLVWRYDLRGDVGEPISKHHCEDLELKIGKSDRSIMLNSNNIRGLRDKNQHIRIQIRKDPSFMKKLKHGLKDFILNYGPLTLIEMVVKPIRSWGHISIYSKNHIYDFFQGVGWLVRVELSSSEMR